MRRQNPNIIITGTPGVGKTSHCQELATATGLQHVSINQIVKERSCHEGWDKDFTSWIVDEDKLLDALEDDGVPTKGGCILDWHACDVFPESWIDLVVVLRTDSKFLFDRLSSRGYEEKKLQENMDSEIWGLLLEEAKQGFEEQIVVELKSNDAEEIDSNVSRLQTWISNWKAERAKEEDDTAEQAD